MVVFDFTPLCSKASICFHRRRAKGGDKDSQRAVNEQIERHRALLTKADNRVEGMEDQEDEEEKVRVEALLSGLFQ